MGTLSGVPRPATGKTPVHNFRIPDPVWKPAERVAGKLGETVTDVVIRALKAYARRHPQLAAEDPPDRDES